jgi:hypothetical protein
MIHKSGFRSQPSEVELRPCHIHATPHYRGTPNDGQRRPGLALVNSHLDAQWAGLMTTRLEQGVAGSNPVSPTDTLAGPVSSITAARGPFVLITDAVKC